MEWWQSGSPRPKNSDGKNPLENSRLDFLGLIKHHPNLLSSKGPNYQRRVLSHLLQLKGILKENSRGKVTKVILFLHDNAPAHRALATQKKLGYLSFQCVGPPPFSPDLAPLDYHLLPGLKYN